MNTRLIRKRKEGTWDRATLRHLRHKYGTNKKLFLLLRGVYLALCEIIEDFNDKPIIYFTKTVGSYAGCDRHTAGRYLTILEKEGILVKHQFRDPKTKRFIGGTIVEIRDIADYVPYQEKDKKGTPVGKEIRWSDTPPSISINTNITNKSVYETYKEELENITRWAYERAEIPPSCNRESFKGAVARAIENIGYERVRQCFSYETNAIAFLVNIKNA